MSTDWYDVVSSGVGITQGDIILDCFVSQWVSKEDASDDDAGQFKIAEYEYLLQVQKADVIVMTQACDIAAGKVSQLVLCPVETATLHQERWKPKMESTKKKQNAPNPAPNTDDWKNYVKDVRDGFQFNLAILDRCPTVGNDHLFVDFAEIYSVPRKALDEYVLKSGKDRATLKSPYREHLSQSFARFFMRVGLPTRISEVPFNKTTG